MAGSFNVRTFFLAFGLIVSFIGLSPPTGSGGCATAQDRSVVDAPVDTSRISVLIDWGTRALESGRFSEAERCFLEVLELDWNHPRAYTLLQNSRAQRAKAISDWKRQARTAADNHRWDRAQDLYEKILREDSLNRVARNELSRLRDLRRIDEYIAAGLQRFIMGDYLAAHDAFVRALEIDSTDSVAALYARRAEQETVQSSSLADLRSDDAAWTTYLEALKQFRAGDLTRAEALWQTILEKYPGNEAVLSNLEQVIRRKKGEVSVQEPSP
ncbi:MAG: hypothetical protein Kow0074_15110 [Candidatus Zixiibacteriota bacterium]